MKPSVYSTALLALVALTIFAIPVFPQNLHRGLYGIFFTLIIIAAASSMDRGRRILFRFAIASIILAWIANFLEMEIVLMVSRTAIFLFFIAIVVGLIGQIARRQHVTARVIMESISGYLLLGIVFSLIVTVITAIHPGAFSFPAMDTSPGSLALHQSDFIYYAFVTYTTLGYGEIVPITPYAKSFAILMSVAGPIYLTVIIAMLVGKFLSHSEEQRSGN